MTTAARAEVAWLAGADAAAARHASGGCPFTGTDLQMRQVRAWRAKSASRKVFIELFSFPGYVARLDGIAADLLGAPPGRGSRRRASKRRERGL